MRYHIIAFNPDLYLNYCEAKNLPWVFWCKEREEAVKLADICKRKEMQYVTINLDDPDHVW